jgi:hypothetical protein
MMTLFLESAILELGMVYGLGRVCIHFLVAVIS